ncbi:hypothetical protein ID866_5507 [Astraeus odoratus]|nr:hypothetical protein ID866_5507 [Astraeus odoratus]
MTSSYPIDKIKRLYDINVHGAFFTARQAAKHMIPQGGGSIVLVASMSATIVNIPQVSGAGCYARDMIFIIFDLEQYQTPYNASKAAVRQMASSLAVEWARQGVRVNTLSPGYILTRLTKKVLVDDPKLKVSVQTDKIMMNPISQPGVCSASVDMDHFPESGGAAAAPKSKSFLPSFSLDGKVCMVTGAARGLGYEFCLAFIRSGCTQLAIIDLEETAAKAAAAELVADACSSISDMTPETLTVAAIGCDVSSEIDVQKAFETVMNTFGRVDVVVASAGIVENYSAFDYPSDRIKLLYDVNVHGTFFTAREAAKNMIPQGGGSIILVASMSASIINIPQLQTPYNASKAAVKHMASSLAVEWAKQGVRVNALSPGYMLTSLTKTILANNQELKVGSAWALSLSAEFSGRQKTWESLTPMGRMGEPEDLATKPASTSSSSQPSSSTFEFTKRKRWADLLIHELSEAIIFVLSNDAKVWFCGRAITELLGWRDAELIDRNFTDFVNAEDQQAFHAAFQDSLRTRTEMNSYIRLKCRNGFAVQHVPQSQVLFELKGYPHYLDNESMARCFFAVAKPYPSRNVAIT